jgi:hypothetical protein
VAFGWENRQTSARPEVGESSERSERPDVARGERAERANPEEPEERSSKGSVTSTFLRKWLLEIGRSPRSATRDIEFQNSIKCARDAYTA